MRESVKTVVTALLRKTRMISVSNLATATNAAFGDLLPILNILQQEGVIRQGGNACRSSCTQCASNSCETPQHAWRENSIVISLVKEAES